MARQLHIDEKQMRQWRKQKGCIQKEINDGGSRKKRKRLRGGGQKAAHYDVESSLAGWVISQREKHLRVTRQSIASLGKQMIQDPDFKASRGWIDRFMRDWGFTIRMKTINCWTTFAPGCLQ